MMVMRSVDRSSGAAPHAKASHGSSSAADRDLWPDCPSCPKRQRWGRLKLQRREEKIISNLHRTVLGKGDAPEDEVMP